MNFKNNFFCLLLQKHENSICRREKKLKELLGHRNGLKIISKNRLS